MSNLKKFESLTGNGYSIGSLIPEQYVADLGSYHPPRNFNPNKFNMISRENASVLQFKLIKNSGWTTNQEALFQKMKFIEKEPVDPNTLKLKQKFKINGYLLENCEMTMFYDESNKAIIQEKLFWSTGGDEEKNSSSFNTYWLWIP